MSHGMCRAASAQTDLSRFVGIARSPVYLSSLPKRVGGRPSTQSCLPHSQLSDNPSRAVWEALNKRVFESEEFPAAEGPLRSLVSLPQSRALFLRRGEKFTHTNTMIDREFAHVHGAEDGSLHVRLSDADARTLVQSEWGELHLLAGDAMPLGLVMVYAPRNAEEIEIVMDVIKASYKFARGEKPLDWTT